jgi:ribosomal protein L16 Arg81 hydroxylase
MDERELGVSESEIHEAWRRALGFDESPDDPEAKSVADLAEWFGCSTSSAKRRADLAVKDGTMERLQVNRRRKGDQVMRKLTVYRLLPSTAAD